MKADKMGYSLNQRGLYANVIRNKEREKVTEGELLLAIFTTLPVFVTLEARLGTMGRAWRFVAG